MIDLGAPSRVVAGVTLLRDHAAARHFYALPPAPRVAMADGVPQLSLLRLVRGGELSAALLDLSLELSWPDDTLAEVQRTLDEELGEGRYTLGAVEAVAAEAELFLARRDDPGGAPPDAAPEPVLRQVYATAAAALAAPHRARFSLRLSPEDARLIEAGMRSGAAPVGAVFRLAVEALRPGRRVLAHIDWRRVYEHFSAHFRAGALFYVDDVRRLVERLVEDRVIEIDAVEGLDDETSTGDVDLGAERDAPDTSVAQVLEWVQRSLLERFSQPVMPLSRAPAQASLGTVGELFGAGHAYILKSLVQEEHLATTFDYQRPDALRRTLAVQAHLADVLNGADLDAHAVTVGSDLEFFRRMAFTLQAARPLRDYHVAEVVAHWTWGRSTRALRLIPDAEVDRAEAWADASPDGAWSLDVNVTMAADAPVDAGATATLPPATGHALGHTLDLETGLGLRRVTLIAPPDMSDVLGIRVRAVHLRDVEIAAHEALITAEAPRSELWFRAVAPGDRILAEPMWLLASGRVLAGEPLPVNTAVLPLPPPVTWRTLRVISDADWSELARVSVVIQTHQGAPSFALDFDGPNQSRAIRLEYGADHDGGPLRYRFRTTRSFTSGRVEEDDWTETDASTLLLGAASPFELVVEVVPVGPELPQAGVRLIEVRLLYLDPDNQLRHEGHALLHSLAERFVWRVPLADPSRREYEYRVIIHRLAGGEVTRARKTSSDRLLPIAVSTDA